MSLVPTYSTIRFCHEKDIDCKICLVNFGQPLTFTVFRCNVVFSVNWRLSYFFLSFGEFIFISVEKFGILCYQYTFVNGVLTFTAMELVQDCNLEKKMRKYRERHCKFDLFEAFVKILGSCKFKIISRALIKIFFVCAQHVLRYHLI